MTAHRTHTGRQHLKAKHIIDLSKYFDKHLITHDDSTSEYKEGYSDEAIRNLYADPDVTTKQIARLRERLFGPLRQRPTQGSLGKRMAALEARVAALEAERRPHSPEYERKTQDKLNTNFHS